MTALRIELPTRLIQKMGESELEDQELITAALDMYFSNSTRFMDIVRWQTHIESKIVDLQQQLDLHRSKSTENVDVFDSDMCKRLASKIDPLELPSAKTTKTVHELIKSPKKESKEEISNFNLPF